MDECKIFWPSALAPRDRTRLRQSVRETCQLDTDEQAQEYRRLANENVDADEETRVDALKIAACFSIIADLVEQGWEISAGDVDVVMRPASFEAKEGEQIHHVKQRIRKGLQASSNRQLAEKSVRAFISSMERPRDHDDQTVSVKSLVDDGCELAEIFSSIADLSNEERKKKLDKVIRPTVQECVSDARCDTTGLKLTDIWRYFRHSWSLEYNPLPGRTQRFLIRNAARKNMPVMGIAMLASPTANLGSRDEWIGWQYSKLVDGLIDETIDPKTAAKTLFNTLQQAVSDIHSDDILNEEELSNPNSVTIFKLSQSAALAQADRKNDLAQYTGAESIDIRAYDKQKITDEEWRELSGTSLYRKKRAEQLIPLLEAISTLRSYNIEKEPVTALYSALVQKDGQSAVRIALNEIKKRKLATEVADLAVCGAIAPYNDLLAGKLVTLVMASREVRKMYAERYGNQASEIASQIAGRRMVRSPDLKLITTTSLYGVGSSQYNRLKLRKQQYPMLADDLEWVPLREGQGVSITHISDQTVQFMRDLGIAVYGRRRINSVFGEGSSPRMRQVKEGLNLLGINDNSILQQSRGRKVYGCEIYPGAKDDLVGFRKTSPHKKSSSVRSISQAWRSRWLEARCQRKDVQDRLSLLGRDVVSRMLAGRISDQLMMTGNQPSLNFDDARETTSETADKSSAEGV